MCDSSYILLCSSCFASACDTDCDGALLGSSWPYSASSLFTSSAGSSSCSSVPSVPSVYCSSSSFSAYYISYFGFLSTKFVASYILFSWDGTSPLSWSVDGYAEWRLRLPWWWLLWELLLSDCESYSVVSALPSTDADSSFWSSSLASLLAFWYFI